MTTMLRVLAVVSLMWSLGAPIAAAAGPPPARPFGSAPSDDLRMGAMGTRPAAKDRPVTLSAFYGSPLLAADAIGKRLADLQADVTEDNAGNGPVDTDTEDGGWDFEITGDTAHPAGASFENLYGPIARGLVEAAIYTGSARLGVASGDVFSGISKPGSGLLVFPYYRIYNADLATPYIRWANHTGNPALKDTIRARHDTELLVRGGAGGRSRTVRNGRAAGGQAGLWPWDIHLLSTDSHALRGAFPAAATAYGAEVDSVAQVILDDYNGLLGPGGWNPAVSQDYHQLGIAGACRAFTLSPRADDNALATQMRDSLLAEQFPNGSWGIAFAGDTYPDDAQATAYAVLALIDYANRFGDAAAWTAAANGRAFLMEIIASGGIVDAGGGSEYSETSAEVIQAIIGFDQVGPQASGCLSTVNTCMTVPMMYTRTDPTPVRGFSVTFQLNNLALCDSFVVEGPYLKAIGATNFQVVNNGGGSYTVDCAILGLPCGATANPGRLFTVKVTNTIANGTGTITVTSVTVRDCDNGPVAASAGPPASIPIDTTAPATVTLSALQKKTGNIQPPFGTTDVLVSWTAPPLGSTVSVYRKGFGGYPQYDENGGSTPPAPATPALALGSGWVLSSVTTSGGTDRTATRDFYYFVAFVTDGCGNVSAVSNRTGGTLNYHLGDVHNAITNCVGDDMVSTSDISFLGANYGINVVINGALECLDVGPTTDFSVDGRPTTDNKIQFEDLIMFAINYGQVSSHKSTAPAPAAMDQMRIRVPALPRVGETFVATLELSGTGRAMGFSTQLRWNEAVVEPISVEGGALLAAQATPGVAFSSRPGNVDVAVLGAGAGLQGIGDLAVVHFRVKAAGDAGIAIASVDARDSKNQSMALDQPVSLSVPATSGLAAARPMPFRDHTMLEYALAREGRTTLGIYGIDGRRIRTLANGVRGAGIHRIEWDGRDDSGREVSAGMFFARLVTDEGRWTRTVIRVR